VSDQFGHDHIKVRRSGYCLQSRGETISFDVAQEPCDFSERHQSWDLRDTGEIVNVGTSSCLEPISHDVKSSDILVQPCDGSINQRWFF
jgi:hypothetical protein